MQITGIEVIRHKPGVAVGVITGEKIELTYGDTLRVFVSFDYRGPAQMGTLYGAIGIRAPLAFNEILNNEVSIELPESLTDFTPCPRSVDIPVTADISPGIDYDLYCKIREYPEAGLPEVDNIIDIVGIPPTYELIYHNVYPLAYIYEDEVDSSVFSFTIPTYAGEWWGEPIANALYNEVKKQGGQVLELKIHADTSAILWTNFKIEVRGVLPEEGVSGVAVGIPIWAAILIAALAIIGIILIVTWSIKTIHDIFSPPEPLSEEIKAPWSRETLISAATDYEEYLGRSITPPETLEGMSDQELRNYLDQLAEEVVPPEVSWLPLVVVGGLALLGVGGAVAASALAKPKGKP